MGPLKVSDSSLSHPRPQHCCNLLREVGSNQFADVTFAALLLGVAPAAVKVGGGDFENELDCFPLREIALKHFSRFAALEAEIDLEELEEKQNN